MKKLWLILAAGLLLACLCPATPLIPTATPPDDPTPVQPAFAGNLTVTQLVLGNGDLATQLQAEAPKAAALGQHMFVEFDASW